MDCPSRTIYQKYLSPKPPKILWNIPQGQGVSTTFYEESINLNRANLDPSNLEVQHSGVFATHRGEFASKYKMSN